jgi:hypothetical protein
MVVFRGRHIRIVFEKPPVEIPLRIYLFLVRRTTDATSFQAALGRYIRRILAREACLTRAASAR